MAYFFKGIGRAFEGLGGDAARVQACAAHGRAFHKGDAVPGAGSRKGRHMAAGAAPDDGQFFHIVTSCWLAQVL